MDPKPAEQFGVQSLMKGSIRNKMDQSSTCFDSALQTLALCDQQQRWFPIRMGLDFLGTFLRFIPQWSTLAEEGAREHLRDLQSLIREEFENTGRDIEDAIEKGQSEDLDALLSSLLQKIDHFKPKIREAYDSLSGYAFQTILNRDPPVIMGNYLESRLYCSLLSNCQNLHSASSLSTQLYKQFEYVLKFLQTIKLAEVIFRYHDQFSDLCTQLGGVSICFAGLLFLCWVDGGNGAENLTAKISDLLQRIKPSTPSLMALYLKAIKSQRHSLQENLIQELARITLLVPDESLETHRESLVFLIGRLVESSDNHADAEKEEIENIICSAASLSRTSSGAQDDYDALALAQLLQKADLLWIKILLTELGETDSVSKTMSGSIDQGVRFHDLYLEKMILILQQVETLTTAAKYLNENDSSKMGKTKEGCLGDVSYATVTIDFYLNVIQAFLMELMRSNSRLIILVKDRIQMLSKGSKLFRRYSSIFPLKNPSDMELMSTFMDGAVTEAETLHNFFHSSQVTEQNINNMSVLLSKFLEKFNLLGKRMEDTYLQSRNSSMLGFPNTLPGLGFVDSFLERLSELTTYRTCSNGYSIKDQTEAIFTELNSMRLFLKQVAENPNENAEMKDLQKGVTWAAYQADYIIDSVFLSNADRCKLLWLSDVIDEMKLLKADLIKYIEMNNDVFEDQDVVQTLEHRATQTDAPEVGEMTVLLDDQEKKIIDLLKGGTSGSYIIGIVGIAGIGKTTLAKKVYDNQEIKSHFRVLAWCCISQEYRKREVLLKILSDVAKTIDEVSNGSDQDLVQMLQRSHEMSDRTLLDVLYQNLMGKKCLIVMDDVWGEQAWNDLNIAFPSQQSGSRILYTSRSSTELFEREACFLHSARFLTKEESWKLLQKKVFGEGKCPEKLAEVGWVIAESCRGLPLAVVAIAGLLSKTEKEADRWNEIKKDLNSHILEDPGTQCNRILQLSYNHLPEDLKPCFLYFAAFREDHEVPVKKLIRLWIAEGFVRRIDQTQEVVDDDDVREYEEEEEDQVEGKVVELEDAGDYEYFVEAVEDDDEEDYQDDITDQYDIEDVAEDYLKDLIDRSLIMAAKRGSNNRVKTCKIHDLLHKLCLTTAMEQKFFKSITRYDEYYPTQSVDYGLDLEPTCTPLPYTEHRLSISSKRNQFVKLEPSGPSLRTLLFFGTSDTRPTCPYILSFIPRNFKLLRVADIESINMGSFFPKGIELLDPLRYLAVSGDIDSVPPTIEKLWNLETLVVRGLLKRVALPNSIWRMSRLRHLHVNTSAAFDLQEQVHQSSSKLENLVTLSTPLLSQWKDMEEIMKRVPNLRKLRCMFSPPQHSGQCMQFLDQDIFMRLESLKILYGGSRQLWELSFPSNLKKLSLRSFGLTWDCICSIGRLHKLEVLTLTSIDFDGRIWEMTSEFPKLKILKLDYLELDQWIASSDQLPSLERLVLRNCKHLKEVPSDFGNSISLKMVELMWCSTTAEKSLENIELRQRDFLQKEGFKIIVNDPAAGSNHLFDY